LPLSLAAAVLALAAAQSAASPPSTPSVGATPPVSRVDAQGVTHNVPPDQETEQEGVPPESRAAIPVLPSGSATRENRPNMELGANLQLRTRTFRDALGSTSAYVDLELTPGVAVNADVGAWTFALGYAPRLTLPELSQGQPLLVLNNATAQVIWRTTPAWTLVAQASGSYGDTNQLTPTTSPGTPPSPGNPGTPPTPVTSFAVYRYIGLSTWLRAAGQLSGTTTLRLAAGYTDVGGLGDAGQAAQPRTWGPLGAASLEVDLSSRDRLTTTLSGQLARFVDGASVQMGTLTEAYRWRAVRGMELVFTGGAAMSSTTPSTKLTFGHVLPVVNASLVFSNWERARQPLRVSLELGIGPYIDPVVELAYQRVVATFGVEWRPSETWVVSGTFSGALVPYSDQPTQTYGSAGLAGGFIPWRWFQLNASVFTSRQFAGAALQVDNFTQFTFLFSATLRDVFYL
jgi:hypothetical protein